jgi:hypothetical protein
MNKYRDDVAALLKGCPGMWVDGMTIAQHGGIYAWRTRLSECRTQLGMTIENRMRSAGSGRRKVSEYRYVPPGGLRALWQEIA